MLYFISYVGNNKNKVTYGNSQMETEGIFTKLEDVRKVESLLCKKLNLDEVKIMSWKKYDFIVEEVKVENIETKIKEKIRCITCNSLNVHKECENNNKNIYIECLDCNEHELIKKENFNNFKLENFEILKVDNK